MGYSEHSHDIKCHQAPGAVMIFFPLTLWPKYLWVLLDTVHIKMTLVSEFDLDTVLLTHLEKNTLSWTNWCRTFFKNIIYYSINSNHINRGISLWDTWSNAQAVMKSWDRSIRRGRREKECCGTYDKGEPASLRSQPGGKEGEGRVEDSTGVFLCVFFWGGGGGGVCGWNEQRKVGVKSMEEYVARTQTTFKSPGVKYSRHPSCSTVGWKYTKYTKKCLYELISPKWIIYTVWLMYRYDRSGP